MVADCFASNSKVYETMIKPIIKNFLTGYNGTVFLYGQTTSGKTYTMQGTDENPGILPCCIKDLFDNITANAEKIEYSIWVSYLEIYNEQIND